MAHGFSCLVCGHVETAHDYRDLYRTCGRYTSPNAEEEKRLWALETKAEAEERRAEFRLITGKTEGSP